MGEGTDSEREQSALEYCSAKDGDYAIPFGRFDDGDESEVGTEEVMVGRDGERALLIEKLISSGNRGAFLITGRRGMGKSSFVRYCISEYKAGVFKRFLRGNTGKTLWDNLALLGLIIFVVAGGLLLSDLLKVIVNVTDENGEARPLWFLAIPVLIVCLYPIVYAHLIFVVTMKKARWQHKKKLFSWINKIKAFPIIVIGILIVWFVLPMGRPDEGIWKILSIISLLFGTIEASSYGFESENYRFKSFINIFISFIFILFVFLISMDHIIFKHTDVKVSYLVCSLFLCVGLFFRYLHQSHNVGILQVDKSRREYGKYYLYLCIFIFIIFTYVYYLICSDINAFNYYMALYIYISVSFLLIIVSLIKFITLHLLQKRRAASSDEKDVNCARFMPWPRSILILKAVFSLAVALQLAHPFLAKNIQKDSSFFESVKAYACLKSGGGNNVTYRKEAETLFCTFYEEKDAQPGSPAKSGEGKLGDLFNITVIETNWVIAVTLSLLLFYFIEYEWIVRPFISVRDDRSIDPRRRPKWEDQIASDIPVEERHYYRSLERLTLPWLVFEAWLPTIVTTVNLGFDKLDHRSVIHGMLVGLREEYHKTFHAWNSAFANIFRVAGLLMMMWLVSVLSAAWFELPRMNVLFFQEIITNDPNVGSNPRDFSESKIHFDLRHQDYCGYFEKVLHEWKDAGKLGAVPSLICSFARPTDQGVYDKNRGLWASPPNQGGPHWIERTLLPLLYFEVMPIPGFDKFKEESRLVSWLLHPNNPMPSEVKSQSEFNDFSANKKVTWADCQGTKITDELMLVCNDEKITLSLRIFHLILFASVFSIWRWFLSRVPIFPYQHILNKIDDLLDSQSSRTTQTMSRERWKPAQWVHSIFADNTVREVERQPLDSRTIELLFVNILEDIQKNSMVIPGRPQHRISLPSPQITFVFDELDKISPQIDSVEPDRELTTDEKDFLNTEQQRSLSMYRLMSDMKRMLSSAPAKFIFVGGRLLHDEWLADLTTRQPLLSSIFNTQIYLPSLLTDHSNASREQSRLSARIEDYLAYQRYMAERRYKNATNNRWKPAFSLGWIEHAPDSFVQRRFRERDPKNNRESPSFLFTLFSCPLPHDYKFPDSFDANASNDDVRKILFSWFRVVNCKTGTRPSTKGELLKLKEEFGKGEIFDKRSEWERLFIDDFVKFLTYRSVGTPKKLKDLLKTFIRPVGRITQNTINEWPKRMACNDVLFFGNAELFRIQMISSVYRYLASQLEPRLVQRDDKVSSAVFYMTDFLLKFHQRAFAWDDLERIDELAHIHRAPDVRQMLVELVDHFTGRYLHRVLNGMYAYRFRSGFAKEIEYISRISKEEMAAFNFTLDETRSLKTLSANRIKASKNPNVEIVAGLGELYEYDQDYESARGHYRHALSLVDKEFENIVGRIVPGVDASPETQPALRAVLSGEYQGLVNATLFMPWGINRLRLMMQIGMTYERARNMEMAEAKYLMARLLSYNLLFAYIGEVMENYTRTTGHQDSNAPVLRKAQATSRHKGGIIESWPTGNAATIIPALKNRHAVKHLGLLYQPIFASAWVSEKLEEAIDTSTAIVEREIIRLRRIFPIHEGKITPDSSRHGNLRIILAELHNKAGDLYFFKGRQWLEYNKIIKEAQAERTFCSLDSDAQKGEGSQYQGHQGYLLRAQYHYAIALHEIRLYLNSRHNDSEIRLQFGGEPKWKPLAVGQWPSYIYLVASSNFSDIGEAMLGRVSFFGLLFGLKKSDAPHWLSQKQDEINNYQITDDKNTFVDACQNWMDSQSIDENICVTLVDHKNGAFYGICVNTLKKWLGEWNSVAEGKLKEKGPILADFKTPDLPETRLIMALNLSIAGGYFYERGSSPEDAAQEYMQVAETITHYLWWSIMVDSPALNKEKLEGLKTDFGLKISEKSFDRFIDFNSEPACHYYTYLSNTAYECLEKAQNLFKETRKQSPLSNGATSEYMVGETVPKRLLTLACSLGLAGSEIFKDNKDLTDKILEMVKNFVGDKCPGFSASPSSARRGYFQNVLYTSIERHRFPMLNRLNAMKVLIDSKLLFKKVMADNDDTAWHKNVCEWANKFDEQSLLFDAPLHFTPFHTGVTFALLALHINNDKYKDQRDNFRRKAQKDLQRSREMYTLGREYYEAISDLYYLYDDFNDRHIHYNHALQMAGSEVASLLYELTSEEI